MKCSFLSDAGLAQVRRDWEAVDPKRTIDGLSDAAARTAEKVLATEGRGAALKRIDALRVELAELELGLKVEWAKFRQEQQKDIVDHRHGKGKYLQPRRPQRDLGLGRPANQGDWATV